MHRIACFMLIVFAAACGCSKTTEPSPEPPDSPAASGTSGTEPVPVTTPGPADDRPIILAFGDSLTAGSGLPPGSGYPEMLQKQLDMRGYAYRVVNAGIGGDTTSNGLARLERAVAMHPKIVILELGGND